jgi:hypothetical protein
MMARTAPIDCMLCKKVRDMPSPSPNDKWLKAL